MRVIAPSVMPTAAAIRLTTPASWAVNISSTLQQAFADFKSGEREQSKKMAEKWAKWSDADIDAVVHYYASLQ